MKDKFFVLALLLVFFQWKAFLLAQNMMHYTSGKYHYSMQLPEDWKRSDEIRNDNISMVMASEDGASGSVSFYTLREISPEEFIAQYEKSLRKQMAKLVLMEKGVLKSRDDEATYLIYTYEKEGKVHKEKVCFYVREHEIALVMITHAENKFHELLPVFDRIFQSFTFETDQSKIESN